MLKIKPGILVALKNHVKGGVTYSKIDLGQEVEGQRETTQWQTTRHIADREEVTRAWAQRDRAVRLITKHCAQTSWGWICPDDQEVELRKAIIAAQAICNEHNAEAKHTEIAVHPLLGRIARDDIEAVRAVQSEVAALLVEAEQSMIKGDVKAMREAAWRAKQIDKLVEEGTELKPALAAAVQAMRKTARDVVRLVEKKGEELEEVLTQEHLAPVSRARFLVGPLVMQPEPTQPEPIVFDEGMEEGF